MTGDDRVTRDGSEAEEQAAGVEYRATIRFPRKDFEFMQGLIESGEYTSITDIVRDAVKRFRLEWTEAEAMQRWTPMLTMRGRMMPMMRMMMERMGAGERADAKGRERGR